MKKQNLAMALAIAAGALPGLPRMPMRVPRSHKHVKPKVYAPLDLSRLRSHDGSQGCLTREQVERRRKRLRKKNFAQYKRYRSEQVFERLRTS